MTSLTKEAQCARVLAYLKQYGEVATTECRDLLAVMHPAGRISELRQQGYDIRTIWRYIADSEGVIHRQGVYVLIASSGVAA